MSVQPLCSASDGLKLSVTDAESALLDPLAQLGMEKLTALEPRVPLVQVRRAASPWHVPWLVPGYLPCRR